MATGRAQKQPFIRSRYGRPAHPDTLSSGEGEAGTIRLRHPGYPDYENILISFPALDDGGLHHETARAACAVLADFRRGYLSLTATAGDPIVDGADDVLTERNYYFHVPDVPRYDVAADFRSCVFPHGNLPPSWLLPPEGAAADPPHEIGWDSVVLARDVSCRVTNATLGPEAARLVSESEEPWYTENAMVQYSAWEEQATPDDPGNAILLRSDVRALFDTKRLAIVPKNGKWVTHALYGKPQDELARCFHNVHVQPLVGVAVEFLFARFVWTIHGLSTFSISGGKRALLAKAGDAPRRRIEVTGMEYKTERWARSRAGSRSRSQSRNWRRVRSRSSNKRYWDDTAAEASANEDGEERGRSRRRMLY